eukprot:1176936-Prorocentrum_minimum.AAC.4
MSRLAAGFRFRSLVLGRLTIGRSPVEIHGVFRYPSRADRNEMARSTLTRQEPLPSRTARVLSNDPTCGLGGDAAHLRSANHIEV